MGQFLRDQLIKNVTIDEAAITGISEVLVRRRDIYNASLFPAASAPAASVPAASVPAASASQPAPQLSQQVATEKFLLTTCTIRFDNKGYRYFNVDEVLTEFRQADNVERLVFTLESIESIRSSRNQGNFLELWLGSPADNDNQTKLVCATYFRDQLDLLNIGGRHQSNGPTCSMAASICRLLTPSCFAQCATS